MWCGQGRVLSIEQDRITLDRGSIPTSAKSLHVHCAAPGICLAPDIPIFAEHEITLQGIRPGSIPFAAAITAYIEATRDNTDEKNDLCPPNAFMDVPTDLIRNTLVSLNADYRWSRTPDIADWLQHSRLNLMRGIAEVRDKPRVQQSMQRFADNVQQAVANLQRMQEHLQGTSPVNST